MSKKIVIIGSGFSALSASCYLAKLGYEVTIYEKNETIGGRARQWATEGFTFDMGPSWYWMPDVFDRFFADFNKKTSDYYHLDQLDPAYKIFFAGDSFTIGATLDKIGAVFERIEKGSSKLLIEFMGQAKENYAIAMGQMVQKPGLSPLELLTKDSLIHIDRFWSSIHTRVRKKFKNPMLVALLEFPVLFLGAKPDRTPAFYSFMNHADFGLGTWHPRGGMYQVVKAMEQLSRELGVKIITGAVVDKINVHQGKAVGITINGQTVPADIVLSGADYHHTETLLDPEYRQYSNAYWDRSTFSPSSLLFYVGFSEKLKNVAHHNLFFDTDFETHLQQIYDAPKWPTDPLFYANFPSVTDPDMAPKGKENGFFLIPLAPGLVEDPKLRDHYFDRIMARFEQRTGQSVRGKILFKKSFCINDFLSDYNAYKGNAYGLANTLKQTAFLRPKLKSRKVKSLYFTGQLTVPGPGVPPALISGKLVSQLIAKYN